MNFKKVLSIAGVASIAVVGLASCGKSKKPYKPFEGQSTYNGDINLSITYNNLAYITYGRAGVDATPDTYQTIDGRTLIANSTLTPVWQDIKTALSNEKSTIEFKDAAISDTNAQNSMKKAMAASYKGNNDLDIDMLMITTGTDFTNAVNAGDFVDLTEYKDKLPNLFKWIDAHEALANQLYMTEDEGIYFTPYFDGLDQVEKGFNMNVDMVSALLDEAADQTEVAKKTFVHGTYDETAGWASGFQYTTPYIKSLDGQEIAVEPNGTKTKKISVSFTEAQNIINVQNALETKNGRTLTEALKNYIDTVYGSYIGKGKLYSKRSEVFTSASACYNADELIALLRCVKANPGYLSGDATNVMVPFFPRSGEYNRCKAYEELGQIFGLRGVSGENSQYWINSNGELVDSMTQEYSYYCFQLLNQLQNDGLFSSGSRWWYGTGAKNDYRSTAMKDGLAFMCYDYANVAAFNKNDVTGYESKTENMEAVLPPYAKWGFTTDNDGKTIVGAKDGYSYTRFSEDDRSLKNTGWSIVKKNVKDEQKLLKCLEIMDYMYTAEGSMIECFGYYGASAYNHDKIATGYVYADGSKVSDINAPKVTEDYLNNKVFPEFTLDFKTEQYARTQGTWHNFMTEFWGGCMGIGNIRSNYLESQLTGEAQLRGMKKYSVAQAAGAFYLAQTSGKNFLSVVPTSIAYTDAENTSINTNSKSLSDWWNISKNSSTNGWQGAILEMIYGGWSQSTLTYSQIKALFDASNNSKLTFAAGHVTDDKKATTEQYAFNNPNYTIIG